MRACVIHPLPTRRTIRRRRRPAASPEHIFQPAACTAACQCRPPIDESAAQVCAQCTTSGPRAHRRKGKGRSTAARTGCANKHFASDAAERQTKRPHAHRRPSLLAFSASTDQCTRDRAARIARVRRSGEFETRRGKAAPAGPGEDAT
jgi:hypothetical protein